MGRVYRGVLYPFQQPSQVLLNMINPSRAFVEDEKVGGLYRYHPVPPAAALPDIPAIEKLMDFRSVTQGGRRFLCDGRT